MKCPDNDIIGLRAIFLNMPFGTNGDLSANTEN